MKHRRPVAKRPAARRFNKDVRKTSVRNIMRPGRGGFRL